MVAYWMDIRRLQHPSPKMLINLIRWYFLWSKDGQDSYMRIFFFQHMVRSFGERRRTWTSFKLSGVSHSCLYFSFPQLANSPFFHWPTNHDNFDLHFSSGFPLKFAVRFPEIGIANKTTQYGRIKDGFSLLIKGFFLKEILLSQVWCCLD
jgi:hypothetical protein